MNRNHQRGATLLVGLIILVLVTLHGLASFHTSTTQLRIVGNVQERQSAIAAAQQGVNLVMSSLEFATAPATVAARALDVDVNGDSISDFRVAVTPACTEVRPVLTRDLDPDSTDDFECLGGTSFGNSMCANMHWDLRAVATQDAASTATGANVEVHQGVAVRTSYGEALAQC